MKTIIAATITTLLFTSSALSAYFIVFDLDGRGIYTNLPGAGQAGLPLKGAFPEGYTLASRIPQQLSVAERQGAISLASASQTTQLAQQSSNAGFTIKRLYEPASGYHTVLIETKSRIKIKCVLFDSSKNPIVVEEMHISPPFDEIIFNTGSASSRVATVECYQQ